MAGVVLIGASFSTMEIAGLALDRLRRHQGRWAGKLRLARLGAVGRRVDAAVVAGPVTADDLAEVRSMIEQLGGRLAVVVAEGQSVRKRPPAAGADQQPPARERAQEVEEREEGERP
jgi:hypothetical protein